MPLFAIREMSATASNSLRGHTEDIERMALILLDS